MKSLSLITFILLSASALTGCNTLPVNKVANACERGINQLNHHLKSSLLTINQTSISRANALLVAAEVQLQFAQYPGCLDKVKRAQDYLSGRQAAIISRLSK